MQSLGLADLQNAVLGIIGVFHDQAVVDGAGRDPAGLVQDAAVFHIFKVGGVEGVAAASGAALNDELNVQGLSGGLKADGGEAGVGADHVAVDGVNDGH